MSRKLLDLFTGALAAAVVFVAVPFVLITLVGIPVPDHFDRAALFCTRGVFDLLAVLAWISWLACCWPLLGSVAHRVRHRDVSTGSGAHLSERLAARVAAGLLVITPISLTVGATAGASAFTGRPLVFQSAPAPTDTTTDAVVSVGAQSAVAPVEVPAPVEPALGSPVTAGAGSPSTTTYTVQPGDSLWLIAEHLYGDGGDWAVLSSANLGRVMADGRRFVDPNLVAPGWTLLVPDLNAPAPPAGTTTDPPVAPAPPPAVKGAGHVGALDHTPLPEAPEAFRRSLGATGTGRKTPPSPWRLRGAGGRPKHQRSAPEILLPELVALGLGVLAGSALARRVRRTRRDRVEPATVDRMPPPSGLAADVATLSAPFAPSPLLDWVEAANRQLGAALASRSGRVPDPQVWCAGPDGQWISFEETTPWAPEPWERTDDGRTWHLDASFDSAQLERRAKNNRPWRPVLLAVGENTEGTWLIPLAPGAGLPAVGPQAPALIASMQRTVSGWSWAGELVVTDDPAVAERGAAIDDDPAVLFVGDRHQLGMHAQQRCAVVTTDSRAGGAVTVTVDRRAASLHPLGVTLRPNLMAADLADAVDELTAEHPNPALAVGARRAGRTARPGPGALMAGDVEVRLLTAIPRIDGLRPPIDPKRARRAVELVAYLALHQPDPVTSDRLRTRVLGSADADAAAKTLFNTAGAARRALGENGQGEPYLPMGSKSGFYRVSDEVTVDATRGRPGDGGGRDPGPRRGHGARSGRLGSGGGPTARRHLERLLVVERRGARVPGGRRPGRRGLPPGPASHRSRPPGPGGLGPREGSPRRALQRGAHPSGHAVGGQHR